MSTKFIQLDYYISLTDPQVVADKAAADAAALVAFPLALAEALGSVSSALLPMLESPVKASAEFGVPIYDKLGRYAAVAPNRQTGASVSPNIYSDWFTGDNNFPIESTTFSRKSGGWFGISFLFGTTTIYYWRRNFVLAGTHDATTHAAIARRRWIDGFELPIAGEGGVQQSTNLLYMRGSSRGVDGRGLAMRTNPSNGETHTTIETIGGASPSSSWERFYIRPRHFPTQNSEFWKATNGGASPTMGVVLGMLPGGQIAIGSTDAFGTYTLIASAGAIALNTWARLDLLIEFRGAGASGSSRFRLYVNGALLVDIAAIAGLEAAGSSHGSSGVGKQDNVDGTSSLEMDYDDWMNADLPNQDPVTHAFTGLDWLNGSRMVAVRPSGVIAQGAWSKNWRCLLKVPNDNNVDNNMVSSTISDPLKVSTDANLTVDALPGQIGIASFVVALNANMGGAVAMQVGYKLAASAEVLVAITPPAGTFGYRHALYNPSTVTSPLPLAGLELHVVKGTTVQVDTLGSLTAIVEVLGRFGVEDPPPTAVVGATVPPVVLGTGIHNAPYSTTPWAKKAGHPIAPVAILSGTYAGTGAEHDLAFAYPVHWLFIRPLTGTIDGVHWWTSMLGPHINILARTNTESSPQACVDPAFAGAAALNQQEMQFLVRLLAAAQTNVLGTTYQWIAVCDPGMRFMLNGDYAHSSGSGSAVNNLADPKFKPEACFAWNEATGSAATGMAYKGIGHAVNNAQFVDAGETGNGLAFGSGTITSMSAFHFTTGFAFSAWRRDDGSGDPGVPRVVQLVSYVGNGSATRTIALTPVSGRRPLFAMVMPHNAATLYRDPSHTGTISSSMAGVSNASTGIISGDLDAITVGTTLNANGIIYDVFVLPGDTIAGNAGFSQNGTFIPVEPAAVTGGQYDDPFPDFPQFDPDATVLVPVEPAVTPGDLTGDLAANCTAATHRLLNIALSKLGISIQVASLGTDQTTEALLGRLHYTEDVEATLRAFPWAFATRYATLTLYAGTDDVPVNGDWQYAYLPPINMVFARRLVTETGRGFDPSPATFRIGNDITVGEIIYSNEADAVLEYTTRPICAAGAGDALFRDALSWRHAASLAPALAKDLKKQAYCFQMFDLTIGRAQVRAGNEAQPEKNNGDATWTQDRA